MQQKVEKSVSSIGAITLKVVQSVPIIIRMTLQWKIID